MAPIPGANQLGQGIPGGGSGLPGGLPLPGGGLTGPPAGSIPGIPGLPRVAAPVGPRPTASAALPVKVRTGTANAAAEVGTGLSSIIHRQNLKENPGSTKSIQDAYQILLDVESGHVKPEQAAKLMQGLTLGDQGKLQDLIGSHFAHKGTSDRNVLKALQKLQTLPAPADVEPHDLLTNFARDANEAVTGLPAGIGLAAVYGAKDIYHSGREALLHNRRPDHSEFYDKILKPVGGQYSSQYGPLLHGDFGKAYERFHEHPLGPMLDLLSLASAGAGTAGRVARAGEAIDAARAAAAEGRMGMTLYHGAEPIAGKLSTRYGRLNDVMGPGLYATSAKPVAESYAGIAGGATHAMRFPEGGLIDADTLLKNLPRSLKKDLKPVIDSLPARITTVSHALEELASTKDEAGMARFHEAMSKHGISGAHYPAFTDEEDIAGAAYPHEPSEAALNAVGNSREAVVWDEPSLHKALDAATPTASSRITPEFLRDNPWALKFPVVKMKNGEVRVGEPGHGHDDLFSVDEANKYFDFRPDNPDAHVTGNPQFQEGTGIFDPSTGKVARVNAGDFAVDVGPHGMTHDRLSAGDAALEQEMLQAAQKHFGVPNHPIEPTTGLSKVQLAKAGIKGFTQGGPKGNLIEQYEARRGITHEAEIQNYMKEIAAVLDDSNLRIGRRGLKQVVKDVASDIRTTRAEGKARPAEMAANLPGFISPGSSGRVLATGETALREASDLVRAGAIYLRPAYLPNNWAGNTFMNAVHQGAWAPLELSKSLVIGKHMDPENLAALRKSMGTNPAEAVTTGTGRGYVASLTHPIAHLMGMAADQPFRDAAFLHEARRAGYRTLKSVDDLFNEARRSKLAGAVGNTEKGDAALRQIAEISRKAQEEIVKFGHMNEAERSVIRNLVFVYSWMRGAGRYAARFPFAHPIQTNAFQKLSGPGNDYVSSVMGGMPSFLQGSVPIGRDKNGNPILINPFSLNPLGTGLQLGRAAAGTLDVIRNPKDFNKFAQTDVTSLLNPIFGSYLTAREGGQPMKKGLENTIAFMALKKGLEHPGTGNIYPTSRGEALGHFGIGSLFPRAADQAAISKALTRENVGDPAALIPQQIKDFKKATGTDIPAQLVSAYRGDLEATQIMKDFQSSYADHHGASGFRNMAPANKVDAALSFLTQYGHLPPKELDQLKAAVPQLTTDAELNDYANALWSMTGIGQYKSAWDDMMRTTKGQQLTRKK